jgi:hypothetical protein
MSADFKLCIKCDKLVNILDDHDDCYRHRVCNSEFLCEICKSWTSEKPQSVERMIDKARLAATKKQSRSTDVETCPSSPLTGTRQCVASSLLTRADNQNNQSLLTGTVTTQSPLTGTGAIQSPLVLDCFLVAAKRALSIIRSTDWRFSDVQDLQISYGNSLLQTRWR